MMNLKQKIHSPMPLNIGLLDVDAAPEELKSICPARGWDLALVDLQHNPYTEPMLVDLCRAAAAIGLPLMLRIPHSRATWQITRLLDFGAAAILVPMVEDHGTVAEAIENFYYPPKGKRSCGLSYAYGWDGSQPALDYGAWWNDNGVLAIQIETVRAVLNARQLVLPGVDMLLFGAIDLSFSLGARSNCPFASVEECQQHVIEQTRDLDARVCVGEAPYGQF